MRITTELIAGLSPCKDRFDNWKYHYGNRRPSLHKFTKLVNITHLDKIWVLIRLLSEENKVVFTIDMALSATQYTAAATAAAYDAAANANAASYAATSYAAASYGAANASADAASYAAASYGAAAANAASYATAAAYASYIYTAANATYADANAAAGIQEEKEQLEILIYLIEGQENV